MTGVRIVSVGHTDHTVMLDSLAEVRVYSANTVVLESTGVRRLTVVNGKVRDEKVTDAHTRDRLTRLFQEGD